MSGHQLSMFTTRLFKHVRRFWGETQSANSFSTTALKMCNGGLKVKLKIFIILHPSLCDRQTGPSLVPANTLSWGDVWTRRLVRAAPGPPSHISIVSGIIIKFQITSYREVSRGEISVRSMLVLRLGASVIKSSEPDLFHAVDVWHEYLIHDPEKR